MDAELFRLIFHQSGDSFVALTTVVSVVVIVFHQSPTRARYAGRALKASALVIETAWLIALGGLWFGVPGLSERAVMAHFNTHVEIWWGVFGVLLAGRYAAPLLYWGALRLIPPVNGPGVLFLACLFAASALLGGGLLISKTTIYFSSITIF
jgi:hypothetical protein